MTPMLRKLDHLVLTVADVAVSIAFYRDVLGMTVEEFRPADGSIRTALRFGEQKINLHLAGAEFRPHGRVPMPGSGDLCFLTDAPLEDWEEHLAAQGVAIEEGPVMRNGAAGAICSIYLRDPDGNLIEVSVLR